MYTAAACLGKPSTASVRYVFSALLGESSRSKWLVQVYICIIVLLQTTNIRRQSDCSATLPEPPPPKQLRIQPPESQLIDFDIADFSKRRITDHDKSHFISSPDLLHKFPSASSGRTFQHQWLVKYPWLRYSRQANGGVCLPCVMFSRSRSFPAGPGVLVSTALTHFRKALETLEKHAGRDYHKEAVAAMDDVMSGQQKSVSVQLSDAAKELVANNRKKLQSIVETIILCGRQNIPLRGHCNSSVDLERRVRTFGLCFSFVS